ncbi:MAG: ClbS/DfsB family four-helix bundle protein [Chloroflexota bacterium]
MGNFKDAPTRENLMQELTSTWSRFETYVTNLSESQGTRLKDAGGWSVKDHVIHVAVWEHAAFAMLEGKSKREELDITVEIWEQDDDPINAVLYARHKDMPWEDVLKTLKENHARMVTKINALTADDLQLPHSHYQPTSTQDTPIIKWIHWDTVHHYDEHLTWIKAIVESQD